jgi:hypothetical protein
MFQIVDFSSGNNLKFTYVHLQFQIFLRELYSRTPIKRGERGGRDEPPKANPVYGPDWHHVYTS